MEVDESNVEPAAATTTQPKQHSELDERVLFTPLCGVHGEDPLCFLLQVDETRILLDCGWNDEFDPAILEPLRQVVPTVDLILVSFPDLEHMGALPYVFREFGVKETATVYMTTPTKFLGLRFLYDAYLSRAAVGPFDLFDLDDIDALENRVTEHPYDSPIRILGKSVNTIVIDALASGRILGGSMWRIVREPDVILYAVDFNHAKDSLLDGIFRQCEKLKPTLMISDSFNFLVGSRDNLSRRKEDLCKKILGTLRRNRTVIMPVDCAGRVLELIYLLNAYWKQHKHTYPVVWVTSVRSVVDIARANLGYMNADINSTFERTLRNPFDPQHLSHVQIVSSVDQVHQLRDPKVVLASSNTMESGAIRKLITRYGPYEDNLILLTDKSMVGSSLARRFIKHLADHRTDFMRNANLTIPIKLSQWEYKTGQELVNWKMQQREKIQAEARRKQLEAEAQALKGDMAMDGMDIYAIIGEDEEEKPVPTEPGEDEGQKPSKPPLLRSQSSVMDDTAARTGGGLFSVFAEKSANKTMFSAFEPERTKRWDEYGEVIKLEDYMYNDKAAGGAKEKDAAVSDESSSDASYTDDDEDELEDELEKKKGENGMDIDETADEGKKKKRKRRKRHSGDPLKDALLPRDKRSNLPRECRSREVNLTMRCSIAYVDMEGRASGIDIRNIVSILKPRKVVVVHGPKDATNQMVQSCLQSAIQTVVAPKVGETVDVASDVGMWRLELDRGLFDNSYPLFSAPRLVKGADTSSKKKKKNVDKIGIRYVEGVVDMKKDDQEGITSTAQLPVIRPLQPTSVQLSRSVEPQFVHLSVSKYDIFKKLEKYDIDKPDDEKILAKIVQDTIVCRDSVTVLVGSSSERVLLEGPVSATFYRVRSIVYDAYITV